MNQIKAILTTTARAISTGKLGAATARGIRPRNATLTTRSAFQWADVLDMPDLKNNVIKRRKQKIREHIETLSI